jgi:hypothetical protein
LKPFEPLRADHDRRLPAKFCGPFIPTRGGASHRTEDKPTRIDGVGPYLALRLVPECGDDPSAAAIRNHWAIENKSHYRRDVTLREDDSRIRRPFGRRPGSGLDVVFAVVSRPLKFARQNHESGGAICFVAAPSDAPARVLGFYTLSPASLEYARTPALAKKGLARYNVPVFRLGRGLGGALLLRAAHRCIRVAQDVGGVALLIDAKNNRAARWYQSYGALALDDAPLWPALPLAVAADAIKRGFRT